MALNYSLPDSLIGVLYGPDPLANLETISLDIPSIANSTIKAARINETLTRLAQLYESTNGTADKHAVADFLGAPTNKVEELFAIFGGNATFMQSVLWSSREVKVATDWHVNSGILAVIIIFIAISYITTGIRLWSRWKWNDGGVRHVDYCIVAALAISTIITGDFGNNVVLLMHQGTGSIWRVTYDALTLTQIHAEIEVVIYHVAIALVKFSLLLFYSEMTHYKSWQRQVIYFVMFLVATSNAAGFFFQIFKCSPVDYWNTWTHYTCVPYRAKFVFGIGIVNIITDCMLWIMPIPTLFTLRLPMRARILGLVIVFSSSIAVIFSVLRVKAIWLGHASAVETGNLADFSTSTYAQIELHTMIWAYNVPAIRALVVAWKNSASQRKLHKGYSESRYPSKGSGSGSRGIGKTSKTGTVEQTDDFGSDGHFPLNTLDA